MGNDLREEAELKKRKCCANCKLYSKSTLQYCEIFACAVNSNTEGLALLRKTYGAIKNRFYCYLFKRIDD